MDPNACLIALLEAIADRDTETAAERLDDLSAWMVLGGFTPQRIPAAIDALRATA